MEALDYWRLCKRVSLFQAIMLVLGYDPANTKGDEFERNGSPVPDGYGAVKTALLEAIKTEEVEAEIGEEYEYDHNGETCGTKSGTINIDRTTLTVSSIKGFLRGRGFTTGFFFPESVVTNAFLDPAHSCYAQKLAAAVNAWTVVSGDEALLNGKTPKQAMEKWLREHGTQFGLTKDDGSPNETGIEEICKIANWRPEGGAAKTPSTVVTPTPANNNPPTPKKSLKLKRLDPPHVMASMGMDKDIPF